MTITAVRFCPACGDNLADGHCATHGLDGAGPPLPRRRRTGRAYWHAGVTAALVVAVALSLWGWSTTSANTTRLSHSLDAQHRAARALADSDASTLASLAQRLSSVEATLKRQPNPAAVAKRVSTSVFTLELADDQGSGFVVHTSASRSVLVTNFHVVASTWNTGGRSVKVRQGDLSYAGTITKVNVADDLALVSVDVRLSALATAAAPPPVGDSVFVIGTPLGLGNTVTNGIVSAVRTDQPPATLQFSAPISPGNSGGPVVDTSGKVVGVAEAKYVGDGAEGIGFAIPVNTVCADFSVC